MVVGPCELDVAQARHLEAVAVTLLLSLLIATVILLCELHAASIEVVVTQAHKLVRQASEVGAYMACSAVVLLEELITLKLLGSDSALVAE